MRSGGLIAPPYPVKPRYSNMVGYLTRLYNVEKDLRFFHDQAGHASPTMPAPQPLLYTPRLITLPVKDRVKLWMDNEKKGCKLMVTTFC